MCAHELNDWTLGPCSPLVSKGCCSPELALGAEEGVEEEVDGQLDRLERQVGVALV